MVATEKAARKREHNGLPAVTGILRSRPVETDLLTVPEAADYLRLGRSTIYSLMDKGHLPRFKLGGAVRLSKADLDAYRESCRVESVPA